MGSSSVRDLAYKPSVPQGWKAPPAALPRGKYLNKKLFFIAIMQILII